VLFAKRLTATWVTSVAVVLFGGLTSPQAQALFSDDEARRAIIDMRVRIETLSNRIGDLERALQNSAQSQIQLLNDNERMRSEIARLRGQLEESNLISTSRKSQQKDLYLDLDKRLEEQRNVIAEMQARLQQLEPVSVIAHGVGYRVSANEKTQFEGIQSALNAQEFKKAVQMSQEFQNEHPNSVLAADVLFMKGTALYADKELRPSIEARRELISRFPKHPSVPQALLNLAAGLEETGNPNTARRTLEELIKSHPKSAAAAEARKRLK
jgi:tol-pal system protein YbgF